MSPNIQPMAQKSIKNMLAGSMRHRGSSIDSSSIEYSPMSVHEELPRYSKLSISPSVGSSLQKLSAPPKDSQLKRPNLRLKTSQGPPPPEKIKSPKSPIDPKLYAPIPENVSTPEAPIIPRAKFTLKKEPVPHQRPLEKYNSCSTLFVTSTLSNANLEEVLQW